MRSLSPITVILYTIYIFVLVYGICCILFTVYHLINHHIPIHTVIIIVICYYCYIYIYPSLLYDYRLSLGHSLTPWPKLNLTHHPPTPDFIPYHIPPHCPPPTFPLPPSPTLSHIPLLLLSLTLTARRRWGRCWPSRTSRSTGRWSSPLVRYLYI